MCSKSIVFCFVLYLTVVFFGESHALKSGDRGVCDHVVSNYVTKKVFYTRINRQKKCKGKPCVVRIPKIERVLEKKKQLVCCSGWQYDGTLDACQPVCSTGCLNGTCIAPSICQCDPPLYLEPERKNICLPPVCEVPCINADCTAPNICSCREGYHRKDDSTCEPDCDCINGTCTELNKCSCLPGYTAFNDTVCVLKDCVGLNCPCADGYEDADGICRPICEGCVNSECTAPGVCTCYEGYERNVSNPAVCWKSCLPQCGGECDLDGQCPDIACVPIKKKIRTREPESNCNKTDTDKCLETGEDYMCCKNWTYIRKLHKCEPICLQGCKNGTCIAPDKCHCESPLKLQNNSCVPPVCDPLCHNANCINDDTCECLPHFRPHNATHCLPMCEVEYKNDPVECRPVCTAPCVNATCTAPETCTCHPGYAPLDDSTCSPHCRSPCLHGRCSAPDRCSCDDGYRPDPDDKFNCLPVCEPQCQNASCVSPDNCSCDVGYEPENNWTCKPSCDSCENGDCVAPNECICKGGYVRNDSRCTPVCDNQCPNGYCSEPNRCSCHDGFKPNFLNKFSCDPICEPECTVNSTCIGPNSCKCDEGYVQRDGRCEPVCDSPCQNGYCSMPNKCHCDDGFKHSSDNEFACIPVCVKECINSSCVSPNKCECLVGYEPTHDANICKPKCESCEHGVCVAPDSCICNVGYNMSNGKCSPVCNKLCINGYCSSPDQCTCHEGYIRNATSDGICIKPCEGFCQNGSCDDDGVCSCNIGYDKINGTCVVKETTSCGGCGGSNEPYRRTTSASLAGLELSWMLGGALGLLLLVLTLVVIQRLWILHQEEIDKTVEEEEAGSVMYDAMLSNALNKYSRHDVEDQYEEVHKNPQDKDLRDKGGVQEERL